MHDIFSHVKAFQFCIDEQISLIYDLFFHRSMIIQGVEEEDVSPGFVLCDSLSPIKTGRKFDAQLVILEHKSIICAGYSAVMHIHCAAEEITVSVPYTLSLLNTLVFTFPPLIQSKFSVFSTGLALLS